MGYFTQDEMKILGNVCISKTTGEWRGFAEDFDTINAICGSFDEQTINKRAASHVTATLWSSFFLPYQILVSSHPTSGHCDGSEIHAMMMEAIAGVNAVGLTAQLLICDACKANRNVVENHLKDNLGPTGMKMRYFFDPTHVFKRFAVLKCTCTKKS